jgi:hypothetical protein
MLLQPSALSAGPFFPQGAAEGEGGLGKRLLELTGFCTCALLFWKPVINRGKKQNSVLFAALFSFLTDCCSYLIVTRE